MAKSNYVPMIEWSDDLNLKIKEIDDQHKMLVKAINLFHDNFVTGLNSYENFSDLISFLVLYTEFHFSAEEKYFVDFNYSDKEEHVKEHKSFIDQIKKIKADLESEDSDPLAYKTIEFLKSWLINHIKGSDRKYLTLFHEKGLGD